MHTNSRRAVVRALALLLTVVVALAACGGDDDASNDTTDVSDADADADADAADDGTSDGDGELSHGDGHGHDHGDVEPLDVTGPGAPTVSLSVEPDAAAGFNVQVETTGFTFAPEHASGDHVHGEGHAHLYVDGVKVARLYGPWYHLDGLADGEHEVSVELNSNDHRPLAIDGETVAAARTITVGDGPSDGESAAGDAEGDATGSVIEVGVTDGEVTNGGRHAASVGDTVTVRVTSDVADHVHLHGYDVMVDAPAGETVDLTFEAGIPGVFEVELEDSGLLLVELEIS